MEAAAQGVKPSDDLDRLLDHLSGQADLFSRYKRRGDPDMPPSDRLLLLRVQLEEDPEDFLCRYHRHVPADMAECLQQILLAHPQRLRSGGGGGAGADGVDMEAEAEAEADTGANLSCAYYLAAIRRSGRPAQRKNRRYQALQRLIAGGEYFSDESMRNREPYLYHKYIGRYLTPGEAAEGIGGGGGAGAGGPVDSVMSRFLLRHCDRLDENVRYDTAAAAASAAHLADSNSSDSDEEDADEVGGGGGRGGIGSGQVYLHEQERQLLRHEFTSLMHRRFLAGEDSSFFDYASVDCDDSLDESALHLQDEEDRYFDEEEPS